MGPEDRRQIPVIYTCRRCGLEFVLWQGEAGQDEDVTDCWDCLDEIFPPRPEGGCGS